VPHPISPNGPDATATVQNCQHNRVTCTKLPKGALMRACRCVSARPERDVLRLNARQRERTGLWKYGTFRPNKIRPEPLSLCDFHRLFLSKVKFPSCNSVVSGAHRECSKGQRKTRANRASRVTKTTSSPRPQEEGTRAGSNPPACWNSIMTQPNLNHGARNLESSRGRKGKSDADLWSCCNLFSTPRLSLRMAYC
jgi:hypothetical protein